MMRKRDWECPECGLVISRSRPPTVCPACGEPGELFEPLEYDIDDDEWLDEQMGEADDDQNDDELESDEIEDDLDDDEEDDDSLDDEDEAILKAVQEAFGLDDDDLTENDDDLDLDLDLDALK